MSKEKPNTMSSAGLRRLAEELVKAKGSKIKKPISEENVIRLLHELEVHEIELELQNEELRLSQEKLEESRAAYFDLYEFAPVGYLTLSKEGTIMEANFTAASLLGLPKSLLIRTALTRYIVPDDQDIFYLLFNRTFKTGTPQICEMRMLHLNGSPFWARLNVTIAEDAKPEKSLCRAVISDITDRKQAEEALRAELTALTRMHALSCRLLESGQMQPLLQEILDAAIAIMGAKSGTLRLIDGNQLRIVAHHGHEKRFLDFFGSLENSSSACTEAYRRRERVIVADVENSPIFTGAPSLAVLRKGGVRALQSTPIFSRTGALLGILSTDWEVAYTPSDADLWRIDILVRQAADLIDHLRAEEEIRKSNDELELRVQERTAQLERKNRDLQDFAFVASHDLSEPLRKIQTFGDLLKVKSTDRLSELERDYISRMTGAANRMQELLDALLRYSQIESKGGEFRPAMLKDIVQEVTRDLEEGVRKVGAHVEINSLPIVNGDPNQLRQLFQNLISNALKYHRSEVIPQVKIFGEEDCGACRIFVEDNGIGFDEIYLNKIFQPFQRLHGRNEYPGIGIGLSICKKIVERHGGRITARSNLGKGSTFIVTLPVDGSK